MAIESIQSSTATAAISGFDNQSARLRTPRQEEPASASPIKQDQVQLSQKARELAASDSNTSPAGEAKGATDTSKQPTAKAIAAYDDTAKF